MLRRFVAGGWSASLLALLALGLPRAAAGGERAAARVAAADAAQALAAGDAAGALAAYDAVLAADDGLAEAHHGRGLAFGRSKGDVALELAPILDRQRGFDHLFDVLNFLELAGLA